MKQHACSIGWPDSPVAGMSDPDKAATVSVFLSRGSIPDPLVLHSRLSVMVFSVYLEQVAQLRPASHCHSGNVNSERNTGENGPNLYHAIQKWLVSSVRLSEPDH